MFKCLVLSATGTAHSLINMIRRWFYFCLLLFNELHALSSPQPFTWEGPTHPQKHSLKLELDKKYTLELLLGDAPVITLHHRLPKYQIYQVDRLIEMTSWSLLGYNTQVQIQRFSKDPLSVHEDFHSRPHYQHEYHFQENLTYTQCYMHCLARKAEIISTSDQLQEVLSLVPRYEGFRWLKVDQKSTPLDKSSFQYQLYFNDVEIFPQNLFTNGTNYLYHFVDGKFDILNQSLIKSRMQYWDPSGASYYKGEPHHLLARVDGKGINIQILISLSSATHLPPFALAMCTCVRSVKDNLKDSLLALQMVSTTKSKLLNVPQQVEAVRVRRSSLVYQLSNVPSILETGNVPYMSEKNGFLEAGDIYPLLLQEPQMRVRTSTTRKAELKSSLGRTHKRAAPLGMALIAKAASFTAPYLLEKSAPLMAGLAKKLKAKFYSPPVTLNQNVSENFQSFLDRKFSSTSTAIDVLNDRLVLNVKHYPAGILSFAQPSSQQAHLVDLASNQLQSLRDIVLPQLPQILINNIIPTLPYPLRQHSKVLVKVDQALSFYVLRFYFEVVRDDLSFTNISSFSLPYKKEKQTFFTAKVPQRLLNTNLISKYDKGTRAGKDCINKVLASVPSNLLTSCLSEQFTPNLISSAFTLSEGDIKLLLGPGTLHLDCHHKPAEVITMIFEYNLFYISHSCSFNLEHDHLDARIEATSQKFNPLSAHLILGLNIPQMLTTRQYMIHWLITISSVVAFLGIISIILTFMFFYYKIKFKPKILTKPSGEVELTLLSKQQQHHRITDSSQSSLTEPLNTSYVPAPWVSSFQRRDILSDQHEITLAGEEGSDIEPKRKVCKPASH